MFWEIKTKLGAGQGLCVGSCYTALTHAGTQSNRTTAFGCNSWASFVSTHVRCHLTSLHANVCRGSAQRSQQPCLQVCRAQAFSIASPGGKQLQPGTQAEDGLNKGNNGDTWLTHTHTRAKSQRPVSTFVIRVATLKEGLERLFLQTQVKSKMQTSN